jgi:hypothetical protein
MCLEIGPAPQREEAPHLLSRNLAQVCRNSSSAQDSIHVSSLYYNEQYLCKIYEGRCLCGHLLLLCFNLFYQFQTAVNLLDIPRRDNRQV